MAGEKPSLLSFTASIIHPSAVNRHISSVTKIIYNKFVLGTNKILKMPTQSITVYIFFNLCKKIDLAAYSSVNFNMFIDPCKNHNNQCMKSSCIESSLYSPYLLSNNSQKQLVYFPYLQLYHFWILCKCNPSAVTF